MVGSVTVAAAPTPNSNSLTHPDTGPDRSRPGTEHLHPRLDVQTGDKVPIGGFIITGRREEGSLARDWSFAGRFGVTDPLADPVMELHAGDGTLNH